MPRSCRLTTPYCLHVAPLKRNSGLVLRLTGLFGVPRFWLTLGAVLVLAAMALTYHNDQNLADRTLATKVSLPDPVLIQDFDRTTNVNLLGELRVLAETDMEMSVLRQFGEGDLRETYLLLPVFPVSDGSIARANGLMTAANAILHRPVGRPDLTDDVRPLAVLVYEMTDDVQGKRDAEAFGLSTLGRGFNGNLTLISGVVFARALWADGTPQADVEIAARDAYGLGDGTNVPLIAPYRVFRSPANGIDMTEARNILASCGMVSILFGLSLLLRTLTRRQTARVVPERRGPVASNTGASKAFFAPLLPQDEIHDAENATRDDAEYSFGRISRDIGAVFARVRSRR